MGFRWSSLSSDGSGPVGSPAALFDADALVARHVGTGVYAGMEFFEVRARSVVNRVRAGSTMPFEWTINPYRGCTHACSYCFARPTHDYLGLDIAEGFDRQIVVKVNAVEVARAEMAAKRWPGHPIALGTNTDPYQRAEGKYHLTRGLLDVMAEAGSPFSVLTKSTLILRDISALQHAAQRVPVRANLSIGTLDPKVWRLTEPGTPPPWKRMEAVRRLNEAGIPCGIFMSPVIPGLSDSDDHLRAVVDAAAEAGAVAIGAGYLYLREPVRSVFLNRLRADDPEAAARIEATYAGRSYLPSSAQQRLTERVAALVRASRRGSSAPDSVMRAATGSVSERVLALGPGAGRASSVATADKTTREPTAQLALL